MGFVQYILAVLLPAQLLLAFPTMEETYKEGGRTCKKCPAGEFVKSCNVCEPCRKGTYTAQLNSEHQCFPCYRDCSPEYNLTVVETCMSTRPLKCECKPGFRCIERVTVSNNCRKCESLQSTPESSGRGETESSPPGQTEPCRPPKCGPQPVPTPDPGSSPHKEHTNAQLTAILCPLVFVVCVAVVALLCIRGPRDETCFKQTIAKLCSEEGQDASHPSKEATHQFPKGSLSAKQQTSPLSAASLGPVHVHNPGTVIFSLLSQFTGQVGPTRTEKARNEDEDEKGCPVFHPTPSPSVPLSEEERSGEADNIFFPSQEQGKDYHMSKEEGL
ncbi:tumor necrosis factor receptor superfamily member 14 isoform X2 [Kryptolebias marmoratus]|uniref:tumor necrosis factor receptor superfamily member 14 isoform X2 n=1 Tax=Kryptolebias marmoratus TaxID=37003 RepID=UPI0007F881B6|nr:tumor necrosis factor receptor superfamily member 14 isoform X2 [Kryptolebias marmoratus]